MNILQHVRTDRLGSNLYRLGIPDMVIQRILRHANVSTTATYYCKTAADHVRNAMAKLEKTIPMALGRGRILVLCAVTETGES